VKTTPQEIIAGLDIGTTKICVVIGKRRTDGIEIIGVGQSPSCGVKRGIVVNLESTATAIRKAVAEAELMAGCEVSNVVVGIADKFIRGQNSPGVVRVKSGEVCEQDVHHVIESARTISLPPNHEILHIIPREFIIGSQHEINQPLGMAGSRLEVKTHVVTAASTSIRNIIKSCTMAGLQTSAIVLKSLAAAEAVLMPEERKLGVALIDIGGGTTDIAVIHNGAVWLTAEIPIAGNQLTNDLAIGMHTLRNEAEEIKRMHGCCLGSMADKDELVELTGSGGRNKRIVPRKQIAAILQARVEELLMLIDRQLCSSDHEGELVAGVVLTGGSSLLPGMVDLAEQILNMPVRIGSPINIRGLVDVASQPLYSAGVGLVLYGFRTESAPKRVNSEENNTMVHRATQMLRRVWKEFA
jgi:cell division protein FtsA